MNVLLPYTLFILISLVCSTHCIADTNTEVNRLSYEKPWKVVRFTFLGNMTYRSSTLKELRLKLVPSLFKKPVFSLKSLTYDTTLCSQFYKSKGFLKVVLETKILTLDTNDRLLAIEIHIREGLQTNVRAVTFEGITEPYVTIFKNKSVLTPHSPLHMSAILKDINLFSSTLTDLGFLEASITYALDFNADSTDAHVSYLCTIGSSIRVTNTSIKGLKNVKPVVVLRSLKYRTGQLLTKSLLRKSIDNLYATNLFSFVMINTDSLAYPSGSSDSCRIIRVSVMESKFFSMEASLGYQTYEQARGRVQLSYANFLGYGISGYTAIFANFINQGTELGIVVPWLFSMPVDFSTNVSYQHQIEKKINFENYSSQILSTFTFRTTENTFLSLIHRFQSVKVLSPHDSISRPITHSISAEFNGDFRDNVFDPHSGVFTNHKIEISGLSGKDENHFIKFLSDNRYFAPVTPSLVATSAARLQFALPYESSKFIPTQERFFLGGPSVMRGFSDKMLGPKDSSNVPTGGTLSIGINVLELRFNIYKWFGGVVFYDVGNVWNVESQSLSEYINRIHANQLRHNGGCGIRLHFPIAIVSMDLGFKLDKKANEPLTAWHLNIGNSF